MQQQDIGSHVFRLAPLAAAKVEGINQNIGFVNFAIAVFLPSLSFSLNLKFLRHYPHFLGVLVRFLTILELPDSRSLIGYVVLANSAGPSKFHCNRIVYCIVYHKHNGRDTGHPAIFIALQYPTYLQQHRSGIQPAYIPLLVH